MVCELCGKRGIKSREVTRSYGTGANLLVIENIPVKSCSRCGEVYLTAETLHEIERIKMHRKSLSTKKAVSVMVYA